MFFTYLYVENFRFLLFLKLLGGAFLVAWHGFWLQFFHLLLERSQSLNFPLNLLKLFIFLPGFVLELFNNHQKLLNLLFSFVNVFVFLLVNWLNFSLKVIHIMAFRPELLLQFFNVIRKLLFIMKKFCYKFNILIEHTFHFLLLLVQSML